MAPRKQFSDHLAVESKFKILDPRTKCVISFGGETGWQTKRETQRHRERNTDR